MGFSRMALINAKCWRNLQEPWRRLFCCAGSTGRFVTPDETALATLGGGRAAQSCPPVGRRRPAAQVSSCPSSAGSPLSNHTDSGTAREPSRLCDRAYPDAGRGVDSGGRPRQPRALERAREAHPAVLQAQRPDRYGGGAAGGGRAGADAAAGQVGRPGHPQGQAGRDPGHSVRTVAAGGGPARTRRGRLGPGGAGRTRDRDRTTSAEVSGRLSTGWSARTG
jgi:hypothetical protein